MKQRLGNTVIHIKGIKNSEKSDLVIDYLSQKKMNQLLDYLWDNRKVIKKVKIATRNPAISLQRLRIVRAGGGLVINEFQEILFIFRKGHWDLPKGKSEKNETISATALREVHEETGAVNLTLGDKITNTYHWYYHKKQWKLKESIWYQMQAPKQALTPQTEEEIQEARWIPISELDHYKSKMYPNIRNLINIFMKTYES